MMGQVVPQIVEKFRTGGGLSYDDYTGFHDAMAEESAAVNDVALLDVIVPLTGLVDRLRAGHRRGRRRLRRGPRDQPAGARVPGEPVHRDRLQRRRARRGPRRGGRLGPHQRRLRDPGRGEPSPTSAAYDLVLAFDAIHDQAHPGRVLANIHRSLRPGGTFLMIDINASSNLEDNLETPWASFLYAVSLTHCMSVSLGQGGDGLGTVWGVQTAERMLREAGFADGGAARARGRPVQRVLRRDRVRLRGRLDCQIGHTDADRRRCYLPRACHAAPRTSSGRSRSAPPSRSARSPHDRAGRSTSSTRATRRWRPRSRTWSAPSTCCSATSRTRSRPTTRSPRARVWSGSPRRPTSGTTQLWTRINSLDSPWVLDDLTTLVPAIGDKLDVIMVPKVQGAEDIHYVDRLLAQLEATAGLDPADPGPRDPRDRPRRGQRRGDLRRQPAHAGPLPRARPTSPRTGG